MGKYMVTVRYEYATLLVPYDAVHDTLSNYGAGGWKLKAALPRDGMAFCIIERRIRSKPHETENPPEEKKSSSKHTPVNSYANLAKDIITAIADSWE